MFRDIHVNRSFKRVSHSSERFYDSLEFKPDLCVGMYESSEGIEEEASLKAKTFLNLKTLRLPFFKAIDKLAFYLWVFCSK